MKLGHTLCLFFILLPSSRLEAQILNGDFEILTPLFHWTVETDYPIHIYGEEYGGYATVDCSSGSCVALLDSGVGPSEFENTRIYQDFIPAYDNAVLKFEMVTDYFLPDGSAPPGTDTGAYLWQGNTLIGHQRATRDSTAYAVVLPDDSLPYRIEFRAHTAVEYFEEGTIHSRVQLRVDNVSLNQPGFAQSFPILPSNTGGAPFQFTNVPSASWFDPPAVSAFEYIAEPETLFAGILDFPTGFSDVFTVTVEGAVLGQFGPGESVDFQSFPGGGVSAFLVSGIEPLVDAEDPQAFPLKLAFTADFGSFRMRPVTEGLLGNFNNDGTVDAADYVAWRRNNGTQEGYNDWRANFGQTSAGAEVGSSANPAVPEPSTIVLIIMGTFLFLRRRR